ncbi:MAG: PIG-L family deacetylase [Candidatus Omnitrophica bacterium]|nr:PIG-L family deacetylase [Candidatus Omnitrophota bacterium]
MPLKSKYYPAILAGFFISVTVLTSRVFAEVNDIPALEPFVKGERVLILAPHPDDEDIGCGGVIQRALKAGAQVKVTYLTCGDNNIFSIIFYNKPFFLFRLLFLRNKDFVDLGHQRVHEAINAMKILGLNEKDLIFLGYPDHGTNQMFIYSWNHEKPYRSSFSGHSNVPYQESMGYKKEFTADNVIEDIKNVISSYKPDKIFVSSSSDVNGDHWAYYLYTMMSLADLNKEVPAPKIYPYLVHAPGWPLPRHYHPDLEIGPPLKFFGDVYPLINWRQLKLTDEEIDKKYKAMLAYDSQVRVSSFYLMSFVRQNELFGDFPRIILKKQSSSRAPVKQDKDIVFTSDMQWTGYAVIDDCLWVKIRKPREIKQRLNVFFGIFGYRDDVSFAKMPNILVRIKYKRFSIFNATLGRYIDVDGASLDINPESVIFKIPLSALGDPKGFLFGLETPAEYLPLGCTAFRMISIE